MHFQNKEQKHNHLQLSNLSASCIPKTMVWCSAQNGPSIDWYVSPFRVVHCKGRTKLYAYCIAQHDWNSMIKNRYRSVTIGFLLHRSAFKSGPNSQFGPLLSFSFFLTLACLIFLICDQWRLTSVSLFLTLSLV